MKAILKKCLCLLLTAGLLASLAACAGQTDTAVVKDLFSDLQKGQLQQHLHFAEGQ